METISDKVLWCARVKANAAVGVSTENDVRWHVSREPNDTVRFWGIRVMSPQPNTSVSYKELWVEDIVSDQQWTVRIEALTMLPKTLPEAVRKFTEHWERAPSDGAASSAKTSRLLRILSMNAPVVLARFAGSEVAHAAG